MIQSKQIRRPQLVLIVDDQEIIAEGSVTVEVLDQKVLAYTEEEQQEPTVFETVQSFIDNPKTGQATLNILLVLCIFLIAGSGLYVWKRKQ